MARVVLTFSLPSSHHLRTNYKRFLQDPSLSLEEMRAVMKKEDDDEQYHTGTTEAKVGRSFYCGFTVKTC
jgi:hypothetical protein